MIFKGKKSKLEIFSDTKFRFPQNGGLGPPRAGLGAKLSAAFAGAARLMPSLNHLMGCEWYLAFKFPVLGERRGWLCVFLGLKGPAHAKM